MGTVVGLAGFLATLVYFLVRMVRASDAYAAARAQQASAADHEATIRNVRSPLRLASYATAALRGDPSAPESVRKRRSEASRAARLAALSFVTLPLWLGLGALVEEAGFNALFRIAMAVVAAGIGSALWRFRGEVSTLIKVAGLAIFAIAIAAALLGSP